MGEQVITIYIYRISHKESGKVYIGQSIDVDKRWKEHSRAGSRIGLAIQLYGMEAFEFEVIDEATDRLLANRLEEDMIREWDAANPDKGYNVRRAASGGEAGMPRSEETRKRISDGRKGIAAWNKGIPTGPHTAETKAKLSRALTGRVKSPEECANISAAQKGKIITEETRAKIAATLTGRVVPEEVRQKIANTMTGQKRGPLSDEHKARLSEVNKGNAFFKGKHHTEETKAMLAEKSRGNTNRLGTTATEETKAKMSESAKGNTNALGRKHTEEELGKMRLSHLGKGKGLPGANTGRSWKIIDGKRHYFDADGNEVISKREQRELIAAANRTAKNND
jgi:group I intron endonuclease